MGYGLWLFAKRLTGLGMRTCTVTQTAKFKWVTRIPRCLSLLHFIWYLCSMFIVRDPLSLRSIQTLVVGLALAPLRMHQIPNSMTAIRLAWYVKCARPESIRSGFEVHRLSGNICQIFSKPPRIQSQYLGSPSRFHPVVPLKVRIESRDLWNTLRLLYVLPWDFESIKSCNTIESWWIHWCVYHACDLSRCTS